MPARYEFVTFGDIEAMHDASTKLQIRKHAMKDIGSTRRPPRRKRKGVMELQLRELGCVGRPLLQPTWSQSSSDASDYTQLDQDDIQPDTSMHSLAELSLNDLPLSDDGGYAVQCWQNTLAMSPQTIPLIDDRALYEAKIRTVSGKLDPFDAVSVHIDHTVQGLLQYFLCYSSSFPKNWAYCPSSLPHDPSAYQSSIGRVVESALQDSLMMNCLLSAASSRLYYNDGVQLSRWKEKELSSTQMALQQLQVQITQRRRHDSAATERLLSCILHLGASAFYKGDFPTARVHLNGVLKLADLTGGICLQDQHVQGRILDLDNLLSSSELQESLVACTYDPGPASVLGLTKQEIQAVDEDPTGLGLLSNHGNFLSEDLIILVRDIVECHRIRLRLRKSSCTSPSLVLITRHWLTMRTLAVRSRLLAYNTHNDHIAALKVALVMWTLVPTSGDIKQARIIRTLAPKLKSALTHTATSLWTGHEYVKFWCLLMGYFCAREPSEAHNWFAEQIRKTRRLIGKDIGIPPAEEEGTSLVEDLVSFQKRFFFHEEVLLPVTEKLAEWLLWCDSFPA